MRQDVVMSTINDKNLNNNVGIISEQDVIVKNDIYSPQINTDTNIDSSDSITYHGGAKISFLSGKKLISTRTIKNNGTNKLFELLAKCVAGVNVSSLMPQYLDLQSVVNDDVLSAITHRVNVTAKVDKIDGNTMAIFTGMVPFSIQLSDKSVNRLALYNSYQGGDLLAQIDLTTSIQTSGDQYNLMIEWYMYFGNDVKSGTTTPTT